MCHGYFLDQHAREEHPCQERKQKHETIVYVEQKKKAKNDNIEVSELEERYQEIVDTIKKSRRQKRK